MLSDPNGPPADVIVTGASGALGRAVVPALEAAGYKLRLCGRDPEALAQLYTGREICALSDLGGAGGQVLLHLAVRNNDQPGDRAEFLRDNLEGLKETLAAAQATGVSHVIYPASLQAETGTSPYAVSKYAAERHLLEQDQMRVTLLRVPAVHGPHAKGKLAALQKPPAALRPAAQSLLGALKPIASEAQLCTAVLQALRDPDQSEIWALPPQSGNWVYRLGARVIDICFALAVLALFWWLLIALWAGVRRTSPGPGFFAQERVGRAQKLFICYKFRTMQQGTKLAGTHEVSEASVTRLGAILRRTKLDELPQVWNILRGELSLVGPRPCLPVQHALIAARQARGVFDIRPGITGLAQVQGVDMSQPETLARLDARYMHMRALVLDIKIILATFLGRGSGDNTAAADNTGQARS